MILNTLIPFQCFPASATIKKKLSLRSGFNKLDFITTALKIVWWNNNTVYLFWNSHMFHIILVRKNIPAVSNSVVCSVFDKNNWWKPRKNVCIVGGYFTGCECGKNRTLFCYCFAGFVFRRLVLPVTQTTMPSSTTRNTHSQSAARARMIVELNRPSSGQSRKISQSVLRFAVVNKSSVSSQLVGVQFARRVQILCVFWFPSIIVVKSKTNPSKYGKRPKEPREGGRKAGQKKPREKVRKGSFFGGNLNRSKKEYHFIGNIENQCVVVGHEQKSVKYKVWLILLAGISRITIKTSVFTAITSLYRNFALTEIRLGSISAR